MKMSLNDKAARVLRMIMGMRNPQIANAMAAFGFGEDQLDEGWQLLRDVSRVKVERPDRNASRDIVTKLDAWENRWFPVASASLEHRHPTAHAHLFANLSQSSGPAVAVGVRTFIERYEAMSWTDTDEATERSLAKGTLESRGLTAEVIDQAKSLLQALATIHAGADSTALNDGKAASAKAEAKLWSWYLEWSRIARVAVTQRSLLRQMGFIATRRSADVDEHDTDAP